MRAGAETYVLEGLGISGVVHDDDAVRAAVVAAGDGAEALLPCRVPDLQLDGLALELDRADFLRAPGSECVVRRVRGGWTGPRPGQSRKAARQRAPPPAPLSAEATQRGWPPACSMRQPPSAVAPWPNGDDLHRGRAAVWASAYEIDANRRNVALGVSVIGKAQQEA